MKRRGKDGQRMRYTIVSETRNRMRIRVPKGRITKNEAEVLEYAIGAVKCVTGVRIFNATGGIEIKYQDDRDLLIFKLDSLQYKNVTMFAKEMSTKISADELKERKLTPELKRKLRTRIVLECAADVFLPMPVQVAYHVYQYVTLKELF